MSSRVSSDKLTFNTNFYIPRQLKRHDRAKGTSVASLLLQLISEKRERINGWLAF